MNLDALVKRGLLPWRPNSGVRSVDVWHEYDVPTAGVLELQQGHVLFTAIGETDDRLSVWAYTCLTEEDLGRLLTAQVASIEELCDQINRTFVGREAVLALADNLKIDQWSRVEVGPQLLEAASDFLSQVLKALEASRTPEARFQARLAEVEAATQELVDAQAF